MSISSSIPRLTLAIAFTAAMQTPELVGQHVVGRVIDVSSGSSVGHGFIIAVDREGVEVRRVLTQLDGSFSLPLPNPGIYHLRSERIGYRPFTLGPVSVQGTVRVELPIQVIPVTLEAIEVRSKNSCRTTDGSHRLISTLWTEIQKALAATEWTSRQGSYRYRVIQYQRELDGRARRVINERTSDRSGRFQSPFRTREAAWLIEHGFVVE